jgi:hypothetical protein
METEADGCGRHTRSCHKNVWKARGINLYILNLRASRGEWSTAGLATRESFLTTHYVGDRVAPMNGLQNLGTKSGFIHSPARIPAFCHYDQQTLTCAQWKGECNRPTFLVL